MSLVDIRHLGAPFRSVTNIVTIIFITLVFVIFRLATGHIEVKDREMGEEDQEDVMVDGPDRGAPLLLNQKTETKKQNSKKLDEIEQALGLKK